ncbi:PLP-dependent aminotransferase family protein [Uliginosibacterium sp. sgz301328]|uniref:aminotransferase-like domain-containing protein n=1 Tax=Uliginosibacterium sp. sgz301328 TaxID=3243764 RepID=UPI00359D896E
MPIVGRGSVRHAGVCIKVKFIDILRMPFHDRSLLLTNQEPAMFAQRIERLTSSLVRDILAAASRPGMISFAGGLPADEALFRPSAEMLASLDGWQYGQSEGEPMLRELIAARGRALGLRCEASQVLVLSGSQQGIDLVAKLFIDPGTPVLVESPAYLAALQVFRLFGADYLPLPVMGEGAELDRLPQILACARLAYLTPTFQNPSGYCYTEGERVAIASAIDAAGTPLFEDDPYRDLAYDGKAPQPICARLSRAPWIYQGSFSKVLAPGLRLGYLIVHPDLVSPLTRLKQAADLHTNRIAQQLVAQMLDGGRVDAHVEGAMPLYRERRAVMTDALSTAFGDRLEWSLPAGGLFFWVRFAEPLDTRALMHRALERGVAVMPGDAFFTERPDAAYLRLNFSHAGPDGIRQGVARLKEALDA